MAAALARKLEDNRRQASLLALVEQVRRQVPIDLPRWRKQFEDPANIAAFRYHYEGLTEEAFKDFLHRIEALSNEYWQTAMRAEPTAGGADKRETARICWTVCQQILAIPAQVQRQAKLYEEVQLGYDPDSTPTQTVT